MSKQFEELKAVALAATPGPWVAFNDPLSDTYAVHTPDDEHCGNIVNWPGFDATNSSGETCEKNATFIAAANPAVVLELLAALEEKDRRIAELEIGHCEAAKQINSWRNLAKQNIAEREKDISALDAARQRIAELEQRLQQPIKLPQRKSAYASGYGDGYLVNSDGGDCFERDDVIEVLKEQGFKVEGE